MLADNTRLVTSERSSQLRRGEGTTTKTTPYKFPNATTHQTKLCTWEKSTDFTQEMMDS